MAQYIDIMQEAGGDLLSCESPARYAGGEPGLLAQREALFQTVIAFPDLYEIGMSNNALKILYNRLNALEDISCDRVFAPAPDFEKLLREKNIPLYALDTGIALHSISLLMFTLSYELSATNLLAILDTAKIPLRTADRGENTPIVIAGGPCVSNPLPYARFIDAFWIGEAEGGFFDLATHLKEAKKQGAGRAELLAIMREHPSIWFLGKKTVRRAIDGDFSSRTAQPALFPLPNMRIVQQHAAVEIMRGCPNGCRFCHAGIWYRPMRQKSAATVEDEAAQYVEEGGFREISLSSLSSGDYTGIDELIDTLNRRFARERVSFQLPSLHISTFSLALLDKISLVRKSGLTFAVETPEDAWQLAINKQVTLDSVVEILLLAKKTGYKSAKFYFMIGLPVTGETSLVAEEDAIISFVSEAAKRTRMHFSISAGVFIPKPHTPFQWAAQMDAAEAREKLFKILHTLKKQGHKVSVHDPFISFLEGIIARADERAGELLEDAFNRGARLDTWSEYFKRDIWQELVRRYENIAAENTAARSTDAPLPWDSVQSGVSKTYLQKAWKKSQAGITASPCSDSCAEKCGVCNKEILVVKNNPRQEDSGAVPAANGNQKSAADTHRVLFSYSKEGKAVLLSHLALIEVFTRAFLRSKIAVVWSEGFNPLPKIDFAAPLAVGIAGAQEIALTDTAELCDTADFIRLVNGKLPEGIMVRGAFAFTVKAGVKKHSVPSLLWGFGYENGAAADLVKAEDDKSYKLSRFPAGNFYGLQRKNVLAKNPDDRENPASYFEIYSKFYG